MLTNRALIPVLEFARSALIEDKRLDEVAEISAALSTLHEEIAEQDEWMRWNGNKRNATRLLVEYIDDAKCVLLWDMSSFITSILTRDTLWSILEEEARNPGFCRETLMGKGREPKEVDRLIQEAEGIRVKKFSKTGKITIDLEDLEL